MGECIICLPACCLEEIAYLLRPGQEIEPNETQPIHTIQLQNNNAMVRVQARKSKAYTGVLHHGCFCPLGVRKVIQLFVVG
jgi:hypothetical protein